MSDIPPLDTELGSLSIAEVFIEYDGPKLFTCSNEHGEMYLALFVEDQDDAEGYLYSLIDQGTLAGLREGRLPLRQALLATNASHAWAVTRSLVSTDSDIRRIPVGEIPEDWLPDTDARLRAGEATAVAPPSGQRSYGTARGLSLVVDWSQATEWAVDGTRELPLQLSLAGEVVWPGPASSAWPRLRASQTLLACSRFVPVITWESGLPYELPPTSLAELRSAVNRMAAGMSEAIRDEYRTTLDEFVQRRDLSGVAGHGLPSVVPVRDGRDGWVLTGTKVVKTRVVELLDLLSLFGDDLAAFVAAFPDDRAAAAVAAWEDRLNLGPLRVASAVSGLPEEALAAIADAVGIPELWASADERPLENELLAAARMSRMLPTGQIAEIVQQLRMIPHSDTQMLDELAARARLMYSDDAFPFEQGLEAARWVRESLGIDNQERLDLEMLLKEYGVNLHEVSLDSAIDAISVWGPNHGPAVLINVDGEHARGWAGRRASLAHEFAHLCLDRDGALPLVDVLGGSVNRWVEARARAFAVELLLPQRVAGVWLAEFEDDAAEVVRQMSEHFRVSREVAAWQILNSGTVMSGKVRSVLRSFVRPRMAP